MYLQLIQLVLNTLPIRYRHRQWNLLTLSGLYLGTLFPSYGQSQTYNFATSITRYRLALKTVKAPAERAQIYFQLADSYPAINEDSAAYFANQGILLADKLPDKHLLISLYGELGRSYESSGKTNEGLSFLKKAEQLSLQYVRDSTTALTQLMLANFILSKEITARHFPKH